MGTLTPSVTAPKTGRWIVFVCTACGQAVGRHKDCDNARRVATEVMPVSEHQAFVDGLTEALAAHGVPAAPSWREAIDYLAQHGGR